MVIELSLGASKEWLVKNIDGGKARAVIGD
jgi:hypothetical protein